MSLHEYQRHQFSVRHVPTFKISLFNTFLLADDDKRKILAAAWPYEYEEWAAREQASAGVLEEDDTTVDDANNAALGY